MEKDYVKIPLELFLDAVQALRTLSDINAVIRGCQYDSERIEVIKQMIGYVEEEDV